jgi:hypothetical protein
MIMKERMVIFLLVFLLTGVPSVSTAGFSGMANIDYSSTEEDEGGAVDTRQSTHKSLTASFSRPLTRLMNYSISFRGDLTDTDVKDSDGTTTTSRSDSYEPGIDLSLGNRMYDLGAGFRHRVQTFSNSAQADPNETTSDLLYGNFDVRPENLPSLTAVFNTEKVSDNMSFSSKTSLYSITTSYELPSPDLEFRGYLNYSHSVSEMPSSTSYKSISDSYTGSYRFAKSRAFWRGKAFVSAGYSGNFSSSRSKSFTSSTGGSILFERTGLGGLYAQGTSSQPDVDLLPSEVTLVDDDHIVSAGISLSSAGTDEYQNIGIWVSSGSSVDRLYIYVNRDVSGDTSLTLPGNWKVYWSDFNQAGTWTELTVSSINVTSFDLANNIYRYEVNFLSSKSAKYFKAVNMDVSSVSGVTVTEIEAHGTEQVSASGEVSSSSNSLSQRLEFFSNLTPLKSLQFVLSYSIDKSDQNPSSTFGSISSLLSSMFSKSKSGEDDPRFSSTISKNYGIAATWHAHRLLTAVLRGQLNEAYDNDFDTDSASQSYSLSLNSSPLDTLSTSLTFTRSESYLFEIKNSVNDSVLFSVGAQLYRDVNMSTDLGYSRSQTLSTGDQASSKYISGSIDTTLTKELAGTLRYNYSIKTSDEESTKSFSSSATVTYRPGRFINFSGDFNYAASEGSTSISSVLTAGWRPVPVIYLSGNYSHSTSKPEGSTSDALYLNGTWHVKKFMDINMAALYEEEGENSSQNINAGMSLKF